jgi:ribonucleotide reductase alpha subunit
MANGNLFSGAEREEGPKIGESVSSGVSMKLKREFTFEGKNPFEFDINGEKIKWETEEVSVTDDQGKVVFTQPNVKKPDFWSTLALKVVASKYFWGNQDKDEREESVEQLIGRVSRFYGRQAVKQKYFNDEEAKVLEDEIAAICLNQLCVFNSPVWFNAGITEYDKNAGGVSPYKWDLKKGEVVETKQGIEIDGKEVIGNPEDSPQCSACFIQGMTDNIESILEVQVAEANLFRGGSGTGSNRSALRSSKERLTGGGWASGPVSFMKGYDAYAGIIKSGGKTRRAAKMEILNVDHPDIMEFVNAKQNEEKKAWALIEQGYSGGLNGDAYSSVAFQNCNMSVRVTDEFMEQVKRNGDWKTKAITDGKVIETLKAKEILKQIAEGTWICGDPGIQNDTLYNKYHTCKASGRINATNPCFAGSVKIILTDGRELNFEKLVQEHKEGKQNYCYTIGETGQIEIAKIINPRLTKKNAEVIKVTLDNEEEIICTPDHKFMLKSSEYKEAYKLTQEDSLMPLYEKEIGIVPKANHKIMKVEKMREKFDVYDIEVPETHNFALASGVFVHNCSEYAFLDDTACNLASINLMKFRTAGGGFDYEKFRKVVRAFIIAMDLNIDGASYPTKRITEGSHIYRTLGLGYANLGALLMSLGLPYDSEEGRAVAAAITAIMCGEAYKVSAELAGHVGPFVAFEENREHMLEVMDMHRNHVKEIDVEKIPGNLKELVNVAWDCWTEALELGKKYGYRNAQATVLAPTGTIAFMMDCDTTGIEPDIALVKYKVLAGGGMLKIVNNSVPLALSQLGYHDDEIKKIIDYIDENDTIEGCPIVKDKHLPVFDCAFKADKGNRSVAWRGHVDMMSVAQPFISGSISKTINMPEKSTVEDIMGAYIYAWEKKLKAVAIYRENSKKSQPLNVKKTKGEMWEKEEKARDTMGERNKLPQTRKSMIHKFEISGHEGYLTVGLYDDGKPGEIFITMHKQGSTIRGLMDAWATSVSINLQYGASVNDIFKRFRHQKFEPAGFVKNLGGGVMDEKIMQINTASSIVDYVAQFMLNNFGNAVAKPEVEISPGVLKTGVEKMSVGKISALELEEEQAELDTFDHEGLACPLCGGPAKRIGNCAIRCTSCNQTVRSGCGE